nr:hypothetical protein [uncultured Ottowia sp.]
MRSHSIGAGAGRGLLQMIVKPRHAGQARKFSEKTRNTPYSHLTLKKSIPKWGRKRQQPHQEKELSRV